MTVRHRSGSRALSLGSRVRSQAAGASAAAMVQTVAQIIMTATYTIANLLIARALIPAELGRAAVGFNIQLVLIVVAGLGLTTAVIADTARSRDVTGTRASNLRPLLAIRVASAIAMAAVSIAWSVLTGDPLVGLAGIAAATFIVQDFLVGVLKGQLRGIAAGVITVVQPTVFLLLVITVELGSAERVLVASIVAFGASLPIAVVANAASVRAAREAPIAADRDVATVRRMAGFGYVLTFLQAGFYFTPIVVLGLFGRYEEAAALSILMTLVRFVPEIAGPVIEGVYFPRIRAVGFHGDGVTLARRSMAVVLTATIPAALLLALFAQPLLHLVFAARYDHVASFLPMLAPLVVAIPVEGLLVWTILSSGSGLPAVAGRVCRLLVVLVGAILFGLAGSAAPFEILILAIVAAVSASVVIQAVIVRRRASAVAIYAAREPATSPPGPPRHRP